MLRRKNVNDPTAIRELSTSAYLRHFLITGLEEFLNQLPAIERISPLQSKGLIQQLIRAHNRTPQDRAGNHHNHSLSVRDLLQQS